MGKAKNTEYQWMADEATMDCYNEDEALTGWYTMIADNLDTPFTTEVLGSTCTVVKVDQNRDGSLIAVCKRGKHRQRIPILDLPMPSDPPPGAEWIDAYRHWTR